MPVISNPQYNPTSAYQPVVYQVFYTSTDIVKYCQFTVYVNGTAIATGRKTYYATAPIFGSTEYYFLIDIQDYLQRWLAPNRSKSSMFGTLNAATQMNNTDAYAEVYVEFRYLLVSSTTGIIEEAPSFDTSDLRIVDMATRQNGEARSLEEFIWIPTIIDGRLLSNMPLQQDICSNGNAFVSFMSDWNYFRVQTYNSGGAQISDSYAPTGGTGTTGHFTTGVGIPQLQATSWFNGVNPVFTGAAFYVISFGNGIVITPSVILFLASPTQKVFRIVDCCDKKLKLFWLNRLGGVDNYNFCFVNREQKVESQVFEKALGWQNLSDPPHTQHDFGKAVTNIKASRSYQVKDIITNTDADWIRELFASAEVYIQNPDGSPEYWRVFLSAASFVEQVNRGTVEVSFELNISQDVVTHRI